MQFLTRLARIIEQLDKLAQKYQDDELKNVVSDLYKQLTFIINLLEKIYSIYTELDIIMKTDLKIEPGLYVDIELPHQQEKLADFLNKVKSQGHDPNRALAYFLGVGAVEIEVKDGELYIRPREQRRR
ncbi:MAG: hypothetical protein QW434_01455 [Pyrobaculum sp.]